MKISKIWMTNERRSYVIGVRFFQHLLGVSFGNIVHSFNFKMCDQWSKTTRGWLSIQSATTCISFHWKLCRIVALWRTVKEFVWEIVKEWERHKWKPLLLIFWPCWFMLIPISTCLLNDIKSSVCSQNLMVIHWTHIVRLLSAFNNANKNICVCKPIQYKIVMCIGLTV